MRKSGLLTLLGLGVLMITNCVIARRSLSQEENLELEMQLKLLNKPALKTVKTEYGDVFDCVDFYKQPAFDNPLLKDHDFHFDMKPNEIQISTTRESKDFSSNKIKAFEFKGVGCPRGTVPIKRTTKEDLMRLRNSTGSIMHPQTVAELGLHFAGAQVNNRELDNMKLGGAEAYFSLYQTPDVGQMQFSSGLIKVAAGDDVIKAGWTVNPTLYGDNHCRFFAYLKTKKQRCFNTNCPGFVLVNSQIPLGLVFKVSKPDAVMENRFYISRDKASGNWWLTLGKDIKIGFWPIQTLVGLGDSATDIFWGGEIISVPNSKSCPMGTGQPMTGPYPKLYAYARGVSVLDENKGTLVSIDHRNDLVSDIGLSYVLQSLDGWGKTVFFGGPPGVFGK